MISEVRGAVGQKKDTQKKQSCQKKNEKGVLEEQVKGMKPPTCKKVPVARLQLSLPDLFLRATSRDTKVS